MKRHELMAYLRSQGCELLREGGRVIHGGRIEPSTSGPRHTEISGIEFLDASKKVSLGSLLTYEIDADGIGTLGRAVAG